MRIAEALSKYQWVDASTEGWETALLTAVVEVRRQRGIQGLQLIERALPVVIEEVTEQSSETELQYDLPRLLVPGDERTTREINEAVVGSIRRHVLEYRGRFDGWTHAPDFGQGSYMDLSTSIVMCTSEFYSLRLTIDCYFRGAIHPNRYFESINIHIPKVTILDLDGIFECDGDCLNFLREEVSTFLTNELKDAHLEPGYILEQIDSEPEALNKFVVHEDGITFLLDTIFPHVIGPQEAKLSASRLTPYLAKSVVAQRLAVLWSS
jgi:hypothetical protein